MTQQKFNFRRGDELSLLRNANLPKVRGVTSVVLKAVLKAIDDHGRQCYATHETLGEETGCSARHVRRACKALEESLGVLAVERRRTPRGAVCNHYTIVWSELALLSRKRRDQPATHGRSESAKSDDQPAKWDDRPATQGRSEPATHGRQKRKGNRPKEAPKEASVDVPIPEELQGEEFRSAWTAWLAYRRERNLTNNTRTLVAQLESLRYLGPSAASRCVRAATRKRWKSVYPSGIRRSSPGQTYDPAAKGNI